ncbi:MAG: hypothetical protein H6643_06655 [Caldilineaceae bacterium]|nr:hypothetical protein [Caldilineaceae bacterium]
MAGTDGKVAIGIDGQLKAAVGQRLAVDLVILRRSGRADDSARGRRVAVLVDRLCLVEIGIGQHPALLIEHTAVVLLLVKCHSAEIGLHEVLLIRSQASLASRPLIDSSI